MTATPQVRVITRGFGHQLPADTPRPHLVLDLRELLDDPARRLPATMVGLTGQHPDVRGFVYRSAGATTLVDHTARYVHGLSALHDQVVVMVGCVGGKHRAVAIGDGLALTLEGLGLNVEVQHLHKDLDPIPRDPA